MVKKIQGTLNVAPASTSCKLCGMTYTRNVAEDRAMHTKYHASFINGPPWVSSLDPVRKIRVVKERKSILLCFYAVDVSLARQVARVETLLEMVNRELNAPQPSSAWKDPAKYEIPGKVFVAVVNNRAVGFCVTEPINSAFWLVCRTQQIVPRQENKQAKIGISRIWVAPAWRRCGVALQLLDVTLRYTVYGMRLQKLQVAFSQPSFAGGLLAKQFNGVQHKSGETLVPVYLED